MAADPIAEGMEVQRNILFNLREVIYEHSHLRGKEPADEAYKNDYQQDRDYNGQYFRHFIFS